MIKFIDLFAFALLNGLLAMPPIIDITENEKKTGVN